VSSSEWDIDPNYDVLAEVENNGRSAAIVAVPSDEVLDNWIMRIFPTLDKNRIVLAMSSQWISTLGRELPEYPTEADIDAMQELILRVGLQEIHTYFTAQEIL
jgi:hypothetical protein